MTRQLAKIVADSIGPADVRLTTMEIVLPRIVLAEFNTHRALSRNSASSRAIPVEKMIARVLDDPYIPERWDRNGKGMQGHGVLGEAESAQCKTRWLQARDSAVEHTRELLELGVHKGTTNRLLEPFMWHTIIVTATDWSNYFHLRYNSQAHPAICNTAEAMCKLLDSTTPTPVEQGGWHLPLVDDRDADFDLQDKKKLSTARCARVSYMTHDGKRDPALDIALHDELLANGHLSPFEHPAMALWDASRVGNFRGWVQYRKMIPGEDDILGAER